MMTTFPAIQMTEENHYVKDAPIVKTTIDEGDFNSYFLSDNQDIFNMAVKSSFLKVFSEHQVSLKRSDVVVVRGIDKGAHEMLSSILGWRLFSEDISSLRTCRSLPRILMLSEDAIAGKKLRTKKLILDVVGELTACGSSVVVFETETLTDHYNTVDFHDSYQMIHDFASMVDETNPGVAELVDRLLGDFKALTGQNPDWTRLRGLKAWLSDCTVPNADYQNLLDDLLSLSTLSVRKPTRFLQGVPDINGPLISDIKGLTCDTQTKLLDLSERLQGDETLGVLLVGPPGSGKTMIASALARTSGRYFVSGSIATWQAKSSHLGDMLDHMSQAFVEASKNAPSLMFLDELDSIGSRGNGSRDTQYWNVVINHLLELVQGISHRGDIAIIGASNHPSLIEPALLRAGRLGEKIEIPLPTQTGVMEILQDMTGLTDLQDISSRIGTCSPADLKSLVDEAKREQKKHQHSKLMYSDLMTGLHKLTKVNQTPARAKLAMCIRFASMVVSLKRLYGDDVVVKSVSIEPGLRDAGRLNLHYRETDSNKAPMVTAGDMLKKLNIMMSATASQTVFSEDLENPADMFLGLNVQENENIKQLALKIVLANGTGTPAFLRSERPTPNSVTQETAIQAVLKHVWVQVSEQVRQDKEKIWNIAKTLHREKTLDMNDMENMLTTHLVKSWLN